MDDVTVMKVITPITNATADFIFTALHGMQSGIAMGILSVCLSVRLSNACIVTKRKKNYV